MGSAPRLLVVHHSRAGTTMRLVDAAVAAAAAVVETETEPGLELRVLDAFAAGPDDVLACTGLLLATPARFGYMAGAVKDFFERIYHPCLQVTAGRPYALLVKGDTDVDGAIASVDKITTGLRWRRVLPPLAVVGDIADGDLEAAAELGATLAAGLEAGVF